MYSSKLSVSIHILCMVALNPCPVTSQSLAQSIGTNSVLVRRLMGRLKKAHLIFAQAGLGATGLAKKPEEISLLEVFRAVETRRQLFDLHAGVNVHCPVGANIGRILTKVYDGIQTEMEARLDAVHLSDLLGQFPPMLSRGGAAVDDIQAGQGS